MNKRCPTCGLTKAASEFGKNKRTSDGLACYCRACTSKRNRAEYVKNQDVRVEQARQFRADNGDRLRAADRERWVRRRGNQAEYKEANRSRIRETARAWRAANPDYFRDWRASRPERLTYERAYATANRERLNELNNARRTRNPEPFFRARHAYRARLAEAPQVPFSDQDLRDKFTMWGGRCWICTIELGDGFHWDHVKPLNKGGSHMLSNLRPACGPCNKAKRDRWPFAA